MNPIIVNGVHWAPLVSVGKWIRFPYLCSRTEPPDGSVDCRPVPHQQLREPHWSGPPYTLTTLFCLPKAMEMKTNQNQIMTEKLVKSMGSMEIIYLGKHQCEQSLNGYKLS